MNLVPMKLEVERHNEAIWLMLGGQFLAKFVDEPAAEVYKSAFNRSILMAREVGRAGIG